MGQTETKSMIILNYAELFMFVIVDLSWNTTDKNKCKIIEINASWEGVVRLWRWLRAHRWGNEWFSPWWGNPCYTLTLRPFRSPSKSWFYHNIIMMIIFYGHNMMIIVMMMVMMLIMIMRIMMSEHEEEEEHNGLRFSWQWG